ncbi:hypothetical protein [uncultured Tenacibaculum sp.]|uniref:hypothetical protein n=1 Tax=uncultured Tenacibaculum sp. TaxID=174713 RepID=UPI00262FDAA5|nr:hypothetical protein [uncultured Tenacibaculum sp.]
MNEVDKWYDIVIKNWAQITVLLGVLGSVLKVISSWSIKKKEISYSKLQENRLLEIRSFYKSYQTLKNSLERFLNQTEFGLHDHKILNDIAKTIKNNFIDFEFKCMTLKLFIEMEDIETIDEIISSCNDIDKGVNRFHIYKNSHNPPEGWDNLDELRTEINNGTLPTSIKKIETNFRRNFYLKNKTNWFKNLFKKIKK